MNTFETMFDSASFSSLNISLGLVLPAFRGSLGLAICVRLLISTYNGAAYLCTAKMRLAYQKNQKKKILLNLEMMGNLR